MSDDFTPITEAEVVKPLMHFPPLARYYREQRPRIERVGPLAWGIRPGHMSSGTNSAIPLEQGQRPAQLAAHLTHRERPRTLRNAHTVAHELHHCILDIEGWPRPLDTVPRGNPNARRSEHGWTVSSTMLRRSPAAYLVIVPRMCRP
jgi:hypothetical protein